MRKKDKAFCPFDLQEWLVSEGKAGRLHYVGVFEGRQSIRLKRCASENAVRRWFERNAEFIRAYPRIYRFDPVAQHTQVIEVNPVRKY